MSTELLLISKGKTTLCSAYAVQKMSVQGYKIDPNFLSTGLPCLLLNIITICLHPYPTEFMKLAAAERV